MAAVVRVTRDVEPAEVADLLVRVPRACLGFVGPQGPEAEPVALVHDDERYLVGLPPGAVARPEPGTEAVLLVDEGVRFFDLRAIYVRGRVMPAAAPAGSAAGHDWSELEPTRVVAWDYGRMRVVGDDDDAAR